MTAKGSGEVIRCNYAIAGSGLTAITLIAMLRSCFASAGIPIPKLVLIGSQNSQKQSDTGAPFDVPSIALSESSVRILRKTGIWRDLNDYSAPIQEIIVSEAAHSATLQLSARLLGMPQIGRVVPIHLLNRNLYAAIPAEVRCIDCPQPDEIIPLPAGGVALKVDTADDQLTIETELLAVADGRSSPIRNSLNIAVRDNLPSVQALLINTGVSGLMAGQAHQRFLSDGSIALLPLPTGNGQQRVLIVRTASATRIQQLMKLPVQSLMHNLAIECGVSGIDFFDIGKIRLRKIVESCATEQFRRGIVLLGEAAHSLHPVAAQGFNLTLRDLDALLVLLVDAQRRGILPGSLAVLEEYAKARSFDQKKAQLLSGDLLSFFLRQELPLTSMRRIAMSVLDRSSRIKKWMLSNAAGF